MAQATQDTAADAVRLAELMFPTLVPCMSLAARLGIADLLEDKPRRTIQDLAAATDSDVSALNKVLQRLTSSDIFEEPEPGVFANTALSRLLRPGVPHSLHSMALMIGSDWMWNSWGRLDHNVATGDPAFDKVHGMPTWPWLRQHPEDAAIFDQAMADFSRAIAGSLVAALPGMDKAGTIADLGGGTGTFLAAILGANPSVKKGILADLPDVLERAHDIPPVAKMLDAGRMETFGGDFFSKVPDGVDVYVTKQVMHSWDDDQLVKLLTLCREASPKAPFVAAELVQHHGATQFAKDFNLVMAITMSGSIRTAQEYEALYARAGYRLNRVIPTNTTFSLIEGVPAE